MALVASGRSGTLSGSDLWGDALLMISQLDANTNTRTVVHLYRALIQHLSSPQPAGTPSPTPTLVYAHLRLAQVLQSYTRNQELALQHYQKAFEIAKAAINSDDQNPSLRENALVAGWRAHELLLTSEEKQMAINMLLDTFPITNLQLPRWYFRIALKIIKLKGCGLEGDQVESILEILGSCEEFALKVKSQYMHLLMRLVRVSILLKCNHVTEASTLIGQLQSQVDQYVRSCANEFHANHVKIHYLLLKMLLFIVQGKVKTSKATLKQLQEASKAVTQSSYEGIKSKNPAEQFQWLSTEHVCVLVYLLTVLHHTSAGNLDKAKKYTEKALTQVEAIRSADGAGQEDHLLAVMHIMIIYNSIQCDLVVGQKQHAIKNICNTLRIGNRIPKFVSRYGPEIHMLLGLYSMTMNYMEKAEAQFQSVLTNSSNKDLSIFAALNLSIIFLRTGNRQEETSAILAKVDPDNFPSSSEPLRAAAFFLRSLQAFHTSNFQDSKRFIRETLKISNEEDITRVTTCSLVLLGHVFLTNRSYKECEQTIVPAVKLANKIPDAHVKLWAAALLQDLAKQPAAGVGSTFHQLPAPPDQMHSVVKQQLLADFLTSSKLPEHDLINWVDGPAPDKFIASSSSS